MSRWRLWALVLLLAALAAGSGCAAGRDSVPAVFDRERQAFEQAAEQVLEQGNANGVELPRGVQSICYEHDCAGADCVEFFMGGAGLGSSTAYWGVVYTTGENPVGFQRAALDYTWDGEGWRWEEPEGDNWSSVEKLDEHWYAYEMHF